MKEISEILKAYSAAKAAGKKTALATVVKVEGSSYRQPGARMLVTEDGLLTGAISGGCLEGDALRKALLSIHQQQNKLITYNTTNENDSEVGLQLGCNGIVHILFEYINDNQVNNPIMLLQQLQKERESAIILTVFSLKRQALQSGTILFYTNSKTIYNHDLALEILPDIKEALQNKTTFVKELPGDNRNEALIEYINPPISLIVAGAGNDVQPLVKMTSLLGWEVTIGEGRATHAVISRFPEAKQVLVVNPEQFLENIYIDDQTYVVLMTHNYKYDLAMLKLLLETNTPYIGILGPKSKLNRMFDDLLIEGIKVSEEQLEKIYGPVGLDIGAETSEEIALSVIAEIKAVISSKKGNSLKYKTGKIHNTLELVSSKK
ncbi:XdhC family protein [Flavobacterium aquidurense]|uniref:Alanine dehydrogenase n=1 Tax=Flavobacterium aquidurense TaxID=362413 RepID=A0A0Q0RTH7_9FLAO|nr:XdhC/CoxI family protein [Flavobacterium aquidurense]KQB40073.1 Alanine dehydrogenase [Flavobacterium aquidurense]